MTRLNYSKLSKFKDMKFTVQQNFKGALMKILLNYSQGIAIINSLKINWGNLFGNLFRSAKMASGNAYEVVSLECIIESIN